MLKGRFSQGRYADMMAAGMRMKAEFLAMSLVRFI